MLTAARASPPVYDELTGRGVHVTQAFGMSEGLFLFTPHDAPADLRAETVRVPISPLNEVRVLPSPGTEVAEGETRRACTIRGYLAAPDRDRDAFTAEGFYHSGDLVRARRYDGTLSYSIEGRMKIDRGGEKGPQRRRGRVPDGRSPRMAEIALIGMPDPRLGERSCAYVVPRDPQNPPTLAASARTWRPRAWPSTSGPNASNSSNALPRRPAPRSGRSPR